MILPLLRSLPLLTCVAATQAAVFTIQPQAEAESKETKVYASVASSNFSSNLNIVSPDITDFRSLVQFDLTALNGLGANDIGTAVVRLYVTGLNLNGQSTATSAGVSLSPMQSPWRETAAEPGMAPLATWTALFGATPTLTFGSVAASQTVTGAGYYDWDITPLAQAWLGGSVANHGLLIQPVGTQADIGIADVDSLGAAFAPALIVTTVPEPSSLLALLLAAGTFVCQRRRTSH